MSYQVVMDKLNKKFGKGTVCLASDALGLRIRRFSTGSKALDIAIGGGWVIGRINEMAGRYSTYKTTLAYKSCDNYLRLNPEHMIYYIDVEKSVDVQWLRRNMCDPSRFSISQPDTGEQAVDIVSEILRNTKNALIVIDSIASLIPYKEVENPTAKGSMGKQPALVSRLMRKMVSLMKQDLLVDGPKNTVIVLNQARVNMGLSYGDPETIPGGRALEHHVSIRVRLRRKETLYEELKADGETVKQSIGAVMGFLVMKNKTGGNDQEKGVFTFYKKPRFGYKACTIDNALDLLPLAIVFRIVKRKGNAYSYSGFKKNGREAFCANLTKRDMLDDLYKDVLEEYNRRMLPAEEKKSRKRLEFS